MGPQSHFPAVLWSLGTIAKDWENANYIGLQVWLNGLGSLPGLYTVVAHADDDEWGHTMVRRLVPFELEALEQGKLP